MHIMKAQVTLYPKEGIATFLCPVCDNEHVATPGLESTQCQQCDAEIEVCWPHDDPAEPGPGYINQD